MMQATAERAGGRGSPPRDVPGLAARFEEHWDELLRFILNRPVYSGPAGDLSHVQLVALRALADQDLRMSDLAARLGLAESSATRLVDRLESAGLMARGASHPDRRCVMAGLTASGRRIVEQVRDERRQFLTQILEALPRKERGELVHLFGRVAQELRAREGARS